MSLLLLRVGTFPIEEHDFSLLGKNNLINKPIFKTFFYKILKSINHLILKLNVAHKKIYFQHFSRYFQIRQRLIRKTPANPQK